MTFLFSLNTTVSQPSVSGVEFQEVPEGSSIVAMVRDLNGDGSTGTIETAALVSGPFTPTTIPRELLWSVVLALILMFVFITFLAYIPDKENLRQNTSKLILYFPML